MAAGLYTENTVLVKYGRSSRKLMSGSWGRLPYLGTRLTANVSCSGMVGRLYMYYSIIIIGFDD